MTELGFIGIPSYEGVWDGQYCGRPVFSLRKEKEKGFVNGFWKPICIVYNKAELTLPVEPGCEEGERRGSGV